MLGQLNSQFSNQGQGQGGMYRRLSVKMSDIETKHKPNRWNTCSITATVTSTTLLLYSALSGHMQGQLLYTVNLNIFMA